jgi:hypothetical protein
MSVIMLEQNTGAAVAREISVITLSAGEFDTYPSNSHKICAVMDMGR